VTAMVGAEKCMRSYRSSAAVRRIGDSGFMLCLVQIYYNPYSPIIYNITTYPSNNSYASMVVASRKIQYISYRIKVRRA
jgi:hypothetical protein